MRIDEGDLLSHRLEKKIVDVQGEKIQALTARRQTLATALMEALELVLMLADNDESPAALQAMGRRDELMVVLTEAD